MANFYNSLTDKLIKFIEEQHIFFVATATAGSRINLSPKGMDTLKVLSGTNVLWLNLTGSGNETAAHLLQNGKITIMFCSFGKKPLILRLYGQGKAIYADHDNWSTLISHFGEIPGARQLIDVQIESLQTSCGFAVPFMEFKGERDQLIKWSKNKGEDGLKNYWGKKNMKSIDNQPTGQEI